MSDFSKIEFETGVDFGTLDAEHRLLALRALGNLLPDITASALTYSRALQGTVMRNLPKPGMHPKQIAQALEAMEREANALTEDYGRRVLNYIGATCDLLKTYGLQSNQNQTRN